MNKQRHLDYVHERLATQFTAKAPFVRPYMHGYQTYIGKMWERDGSLTARLKHSENYSNEAAETVSRLEMPNVIGTIRHV